MLTFRPKQMDGQPMNLMRISLDPHGHENAAHTTVCGDDNDAGSTPRNLLSHKSSNINNSTSTCTMRAALRTVTADEERAQAQHPTQVHAAKSTTKNHEDMNTNSGNDKHADKKDSSSTTSSRTPLPLPPPRTGSGASTLRLHEERAAHEQHAAARLHASDLRPHLPSAIQTAAGNAEASAGPKMHYNTEHQVSASLETAARAPQILDIKLTCGEGTGRARDEELSVTINLAACAWKTAGLMGKQQPPASQPGSQTVRQSGVPESHPHGHRHKYITHTTRDTWTSLPLQALVSHCPHPAPCHRLLPRVPPPVFEPTVFDVARAQAAAGCTPSTRGGGYWLPIRPPLRRCPACPHRTLRQRPTSTAGNEIDAGLRSASSSSEPMHTTRPAKSTGNTNESVRRRWPGYSLRYCSGSILQGTLPPTYRGAFPSSRALRME